MSAARERDEQARERGAARVRREEEDVRATATALAALDDGALAALAYVEPGVATSSFQTEGGLDGDGEPETNWRAWVTRGRAERIGRACDLWRRYPLAARRAGAMGLRLFRASLEWARLCPDGPTVDRRVAAQYARRLATLQRAGLEPVLTLQHFTHPSWAGADLWLDAQAPWLFARYAGDAAAAVNDALVALGARPVRRFVTVNEPNMLALATYAAGVFPHGVAAAADGDPRGALRALRALDLLLSAHVRAYRALYALYEARGWPAPSVTVNPNFVDVYGLSTQPLDLLRAPAGPRRVSVRELDGHLRRRRAHFYDALCGAEPSSPRASVARALEELLASFVGADAYPETLSLVYARAPNGALLAPPLDARAIDVYDPWSYQQLRNGDPLWTALSEGVLRVAHAGARMPDVRLAEPWEWVCEPSVLRRALGATHDPHDALPVDVLENGMALCRREGEATQRRDDEVTRPDFVRGHALALFAARAIDRVPVRAHCHWTLVDNYELGRWAPRFGLFALGDAPSDGARAASWSQLDAAGHDAAQALGNAAGVVRSARESDFASTRRGLTALAARLRA